MYDDSLKKMTEHRNLKVGHMVLEFATPGIGHILKNAGAEFVFLDMEHSGLGLDTIKATTRTIQDAGLPVILRVPSKAYDHASRALDLGVEGIMVPMVNTPEEARQILDHMKYAPVGKRGAVFGVSNTGYRAPASVTEAMAASNRATAFFPQIETRAGLENAYDIAAVPGVDCLWIGHTDLSVSLGIPGQFDHPDFITAVDRVLDACKSHGKSAGMLVMDIPGSIARFRQGFDFICYSGDVWALGGFVAEGMTAIKAACASKP